MNLKPGGTVAQMTQPTGPGAPVEQAIGRLDAVTADLESELNSLVGRLQPYLSQQEGKAGSNIAAGVPHFGTSVAVQKIQGLGNRVENLIWTVKTLKEQLEV